MDGDTLDRELASLANTISVCNPITFGQNDPWRTIQKNAELVAKQESEFADSLPRKFVLTEPQNAKTAFALVAAAAKNPTQPLHPRLLINDVGRSDLKLRDESLLRAAHVALPTRLPIAKRSHMDGILRGVPGGSELMSTIQQRAFVYDSEMDRMNSEKDTSHHRKRDAYSDYVEARVRFSKMHSVK